MAANGKSDLGLTLFLVLFVYLIAAPSLCLGDSQNSTVYEILPKFALPSGLLPDCVTNYTLSSDGQFVVALEKPCYVQFEYLVYYDKTITGRLRYGSITELTGIQVQKFFLWLDVDEIRVDLPPSDSIYFQVGFINKRLDVEQFETVHSCRDDALTYCSGSLKRVFQLLDEMEEITVLVTE